MTPSRADMNSEFSTRVLLKRGHNHDEPDDNKGAQWAEVAVLVSRLQTLIVLSDGWSA
jgi:hypothetical protein